MACLKKFEVSETRPALFTPHATRGAALCIYIAIYICRIDRFPARYNFHINHARIPIYLDEKESALFILMPRDDCKRFN